MINLYSDTQTRPSPQMREFMMRAEVGDEQRGEDPTTNALCERVADMLGKEAAVFLPSGTMCNEISIALHIRPGDEVLCDRSAHIINSEAGGPAALAGAMLMPIDGKAGVFTGDDVRKYFRLDSRYTPRTRLVCVEQTANLAGGTVWPLDTIRGVLEAARERGLATHMDGARLLNASAATGISAKEYVHGFDSCWIDFTKGLGAPVGATLAGSKDFINAAWRLKQRWGGAMRQSGIIAAAALYALDHHIDDLKTDNANAHHFGTLISTVSGIKIDPAAVQSNIVFFCIKGTGWNNVAFVEAMKQKGVAIGAFGQSMIRVVTHRDVSRQQVEQAAEMMRGMFAQRKA